MKKYFGNYLGLCIDNNDPQKRGRVQIFIPHIMPALFENWNESGEDIQLLCVGDNLPQSLPTPMVEKLKKILPWAEGASPIMGTSAPGNLEGGSYTQFPDAVCPPGTSPVPVAQATAAQSQPGGPTTSVNNVTPVAAGGGGKVIEKQRIEATNRKGDLSEGLIRAIETGLQGSNLNFRVFSGSQTGPGASRPKNASARHDFGRAADGDFIDSVTGVKLNPAVNAKDRERIAQVLPKLRAAGIQGIGYDFAGYMGPERFHLDIVSPAIWGRTTTSSSAVPWVVAAVGGLSGPMINPGAQGVGGAAGESGIICYPTSTSAGMPAPNPLSSPTPLDERASAAVPLAGNTGGGGGTLSVPGVGQVSGNTGLNLTESHKQGLNAFLQTYQQNQTKYIAVSEGLKQTGINLKPSQIAALHWRESSGSFSSSIANGQKLGTYVRKDGYLGQGSPQDSFTPTNDWVKHSIEVLSYKVREKYGGPRDVSSSSSFNDFAERFNGLGYRQKGRVSPYVYAGTNLYTGGKYTGDGFFDPNVFDKQVGTSVLAAAADGALNAENLTASAQPPGFNESDARGLAAGGNGLPQQTGSMITNPDGSGPSPIININNMAAGMFSYPAAGALLWVFFREGNPLFPVYFAANYGEREWASAYRLPGPGQDGVGYKPATTPENPVTSVGGTWNLGKVGVHQWHYVNDPSNPLNNERSYAIGGHDGSNLAFTEGKTYLTSQFDFRETVNGDFWKYIGGSTEEFYHGASRNINNYGDTIIRYGNTSPEAVAAAENIVGMINQIMAPLAQSTGGSSSGGTPGTGSTLGGAAATGGTEAGLTNPTTPSSFDSVAANVLKNNSGGSLTYEERLARGLPVIADPKNPIRINKNTFGDMTLQQLQAAAPVPYQSPFASSAQPTPVQSTYKWKPGDTNRVSLTTQQKGAPPSRTGGQTRTSSPSTSTSARIGVGVSSVLTAPLQQFRTLRARGVAADSQ